MASQFGIRVRVRDTKVNVNREILRVLSEAKFPATSIEIRSALRDRQGWSIGIKTVKKFLAELVEEGKVRVEEGQRGVWFDDRFFLVPGALAVQGGRRPADPQADGGPVDG